MSDTGGTANSGDDTAALSIQSSVAVTPVNDGPVIDLFSTGGVQTTGTTATFDEGTGAPGATPVTVLPQLALSDLDGATNLTGATVTLNNAQTGDVLSISGQGAATSGDLASGVHFAITGGNVVTFSNTDTMPTTRPPFVSYSSTTPAITRIPPPGRSRLPWTMAPR